MALKDLNDRQAVLRALEEYDKLGRVAFLRTYGFGTADEYVLAHEGRYYDSKAIAGVAHLFQTGELLTNSEFQGGRRGAVPRLTAMRFEIVSQRRGSFVLLWNPTLWHWDEERRLAIQQCILAGGTGSEPWSTGSRKKDISKGDRIFLFLVGQKERGLVASGHAASDIYLDTHWAADHPEPGPHISVAWDRLLDAPEVLPWEIIERTVPGFPNRYQGGGARLDGLQTLTLDALWQEHANEVSLAALGDPTRAEVVASYSYAIVKRRNHQQQFRNLLLGAYEPKCAVCGFDQVEILEAAHVIPDSQGGPSSLENGRLMCPNHHRAHDAGLFRFQGDLPMWAEAASEFLAPERPQDRNSS
ncbi:HNH endonuclease [Pseudarthrobacter sp. LMD1-1-1.1]|uniref:HNH endonuclease n=1 Tax=Pseudarthrobacter sp. LMD1-1-1.1 TaxID=3135242 RepID=UPI00341F8C95